jgi:hypothetical protein
MEGETRPLEDLSDHELNELISFESERHMLEVETLIAQRDRAAEMLKERKEEFRKMIDGVTDMRIAVCDLEAATPGCSHCPEDDAPPSDEEGTNGGDGSDDGPQQTQLSVISVSQRVEEYVAKFARSLSSGASRFGQLLSILDASVQPEGTPSIKPGSAYPPTLDARIQKNLVLYNKTTNVYFVSRNEIRGLRGWWEKHFKSCQSCGSRHDAWMKARGLINSAAIQHHVGGNSLPDFAKRGGRHHDATKRCHRIECWLNAETPIEDREDARTTEVLVIKSHVAVGNIDGAEHRHHSSSDLAVAAAKLLSSTVKDSLQTLSKKTLEAPWMRSANDEDAATTNKESPLSEETKVAIEVLLSSIGCTVAVEPATSETVTGSTFELKISVALTLPVHVACVQPLMEAARHDAHQAVLIDRVFNPLIETVCSAIGMNSKAEFFLSMVKKTSEIIQSFKKANMEKNVMSSASTTADATPSAVSGSVHVERNLKKRQIYNILHALALHKTTFAFVYAVPRSHDDEEGDVSSSPWTPSKNTSRLATAITNAGSLGKGKVLNILTEVLKTFVAPGAVVIPSNPASDLLEFVLMLEKAPLYLLDALNKEYSSTERTPSTRRTGSSLFDAVVSPQTKISLGLKLFSEMVVDIFRPYSPGCGAIIVEDEEKSQSFFKKSPTLAPPCVPRTDLPVDIVQANIAVHEEATKLVARVREERRHTSHQDLEKQSKEVLKRVRDRVSTVTLTTESMKSGWAELGITVQQWRRAEANVLLPFGQVIQHGGHDDTDLHSDDHLPLLYACCSLEDASV